MNIEKFTNQLHGLFGLEWAILGGYARDIHHGKEPKDLDIIIYNTDYISNGTMSDLREHFKDLVSKDHSKKPSSCSSGRIREVITLEVDGMQVDLIFWHPRFKTVDDVVNNFDYNINQYHFDPSNHVTVFLGENEGVVTRITKEPLKPERNLRIAEIAVGMGWELPENLYKKESDIPF